MSTSQMMDISTYSNLTGKIWNFGNVNTFQNKRAHIEWVNLYLEEIYSNKKLDKTYTLYIDSANSTWTDRFPALLLVVVLVLLLVGVLSLLLSLLLLLLLLLLILLLLLLLSLFLMLMLKAKLKITIK